MLYFFLLLSLFQLQQLKCDKNGWTIFSSMVTFNIGKVVALIRLVRRSTTNNLEPSCKVRFRAERRYHTFCQRPHNLNANGHA